VADFHDAQDPQNIADNCALEVHQKVFANFQPILFSSCFIPALFIFLYAMGGEEYLWPFISNSPVHCHHRLHLQLSLVLPLGFFSRHTNAYIAAKQIAYLN